jgi:hypothetical protein
VHVIAVEVCFALGLFVRPPWLKQVEHEEIHPFSLLAISTVRLFYFPCIFFSSCGRGIGFVIGLAVGLGIGLDVGFAVGLGLFLANGECALRLF